ARSSWLNGTSHCSALLRGGSIRIEFPRAGAFRLAEPGANLLVVLAERWRRQPVVWRRQRERNRMTNHRQGIISNADLDHGIESDFASEGDTPFNAVDRTARDAGGAQPAEPFVGCSRTQPFNQQRAQGIAVAVAIFSGGKPGITRQVRKIEDLAELAELP